jgi:hypothetical protein
MSYFKNINIDGLDNEKIIISKKNYYCSNCNKKGHTYKDCNEPIISNGIIGIYIKNIRIESIDLIQLENVINKKLKNNVKSQCEESIESSNLTNMNENMNENINDNINDNIQFLMVQRKKSLGYLEFIRGRYNLFNVNNVIKLLEQMTPEELEDIRTKDFDYLWNNLWDKNNIRNRNHYKEYTNSKQKFYQLKLTHSEMLENIIPLYSFNEWGFPKGRREMYESDLVCGIREFEEETALKENDYTVLDKCKSIRENLTGTNNIEYVHNYYLAIINNSNHNSIDETNREIGQTKLLNLNESLECIRPYHTNKKKIIKKIYNIINDYLINKQINNQTKLN